MKPYQTLYDDTESPTWNSLPQPIVWKTGEPIVRPNPVITHHRLGCLGVQRVVCVSFSSRSDHAAKKKVRSLSFRARCDINSTGQIAEEELKRLSRIKYGLSSLNQILANSMTYVRHHNIAAIIGVTKGCDGLDGFIVAMGKIHFFNLVPIY